VKVAVVDGLGGGLGCQIIESLKRELGDAVEIIALGINAGATANMLKAGARRGATGENAIRVTGKEVDAITGPVGIIIPDSMMGEVTAGITEAVISSPARKFLLCVNQPHVEFIGVESQPVSVLIGKLVERIKEFIKEV
jgi:hypothetical protein